MTPILLTRLDARRPADRPGYLKHARDPDDVHAADVHRFPFHREGRLRRLLALQSGPN